MGPGEFLNINFFTALFTLVNTVALFLVLKKLLWGPVIKIIAQRQQEIDDLYADADAAKSQAQQLRTEYEDKLSQVQQTGDRLVKEAMARGQQRQEEILRQANAEAEAIRKKAEADIAREKQKALDDAKNEIADLAVEIAGKVVGRTMDETDQSALVDEFIHRLGDEA